MDSEVKKKIEFDGMRNALLNTITDGMTNGDVIMAMFPNAEKEYFSSTDTSIWFKYPMGCRIIFSNHWWYAPYKENK